MRTKEKTNIPPNQAAPNNTEKSRLHSPVLDGPISASFSHTYIEESFTQEEEYESLRSPLLKAKVPLPEKNQTPEKNPIIQKKQVPESSAGQESRLQSVLGSATGFFC